MLGSQHHRQLIIKSVVQAIMISSEHHESQLATIALHIIYEFYNIEQENIE